MYILDTDHATFYQQGNPALQQRLIHSSELDLATTVVTYEEQISGRLAVVRRAQDSEKRVRAFFWLQQTLTFFCHSPVLPFDEAAAAAFQTIQDLKLRIGTQDQLIASIVLVNHAILLTRNPCNLTNKKSQRLRTDTRSFHRRLVCRSIITI